MGVLACTSGPPGEGVPLGREQSAVTLDATAKRIAGRDWYSEDIDLNGYAGATGVNGTAAYDGTKFTLTALGGTGVADTTYPHGDPDDQIRFVYTQWGSGDGEIVARITAAGPDGNVTAGVMVREASNTAEPSKPDEASMGAVALKPNYECGSGIPGTINHILTSYRTRVP
ncbi:MAG TPA: hypothetical protein VNN72_22285, partial [Polyangiaceae bacterium]|nr:hypothetical protein [Polyangiaceae bacterium]